MVNSFFETLQNSKKPIYLYGTGNAAEKIIKYLSENNLTIAGIFASDGFVRNRTFAGYKVISYSDAKKINPNMIVLLSFGSHLDDVITNIKKIANEQELYAPDLAISGPDEFIYNESKYNDLKGKLADDFSRKVLDDVIQYKLTADIKYLLDCETDDYENWSLLDFSDSEDYLDLGAYTGDTVRQFLTLTNGSYNSIYAVEPEVRNYRKLTENYSNLSNCELINCAVSNQNGFMQFTKGVGRGGAINKGKTYDVKVETVDSLLEGKPISFIKMDLEGQEQNALNGARNTIKEYKPKMLISAYHRMDDLLNIPEFIWSLNPEYKIYLRKSKGIPAWEINYYVK